MLDLRRLTVSLTKHGAHKIALLLANYDKDDILNRLWDKEPGINIETVQAKKNLSVNRSGVVPDVWNKARAAGSESIDALVFIGIVFSHHQLIEAMRAGRTTSMRGKIERGKVLDGKAFTNFAHTLEELGYRVSHTPDKVTYNLAKLFELPGLNKLAIELIGLKFKAAGWDGKKTVVDELIDNKLNDVAQRKIDVGQFVREGEVLAVLDDADYRLAEEAARQQHAAAVSQARQADSDHQRLGDLKRDGSVSVADDERATTGAQTARAAAEAEARKLELARNRLKYTVLRASRSGVVTAVRFEVGQVVAEGLPVVSIANPGEPEIVVDVPEDQVAAFKTARFKAALASAPADTFEVALRELSPQAAAQTRTYRARLKPVGARALPLGATATLVASRVMSGPPVAAVPAAAITQSNGQPALWVVKRTGPQQSVGSVELLRVSVHGYRNDEVLVSGPSAGEQVVTAGVQKMAPGLKVALAGSTALEENTVAAR